GPGAAVLGRGRGGDRDLLWPGAERGTRRRGPVAERQAGGEQVRGVVEQLLRLPQQRRALRAIQLSHRARHRASPRLPPGPRSPRTASVTITGFRSPLSFFVARAHQRSVTLP